jgi:U3 small nucleolar RNA-associated protein 6
LEIKQRLKIACLIILCFSLSVKESVAFENGVPTFDVAEPSCTSSDVENAFHNFQAVLLKNVNRSSGRQRQLKWNDLRSVFQKLNEEDKKSWCVETHGGSISLEPAEFLDSQRDKRDRAYCSFLIQQDVQEYESTLERLPCQKLLGFDWVYEPALWIFFGRNPVGSMCLDGRPDHTDSVTHDGTWHYQLSGTKRWILRPTSEILSRVKSQGFVVPREQVVLEIECKEGDVFILNTRVWFHRTMIPPQSCPSVSYARDFRIPDGSDKSLSGNMTNVDGLYATTDIENNTIIFTEIDMPNVELHRSAVAPNCGVVELEDGTHAVVSLRRIPAGEFFTVMESDESSSSDDEESDDLVD